MMNAIRQIKQFAEKITANFVAPIWKRRKLSILQRHPLWHRRCHWKIVRIARLWIASITSVCYFLMPWCHITVQYSRTGLMTEEYQISRSVGRPAYLHVNVERKWVPPTAMPWASIHVLQSHFICHNPQVFLRVAAPEAWKQLPHNVCCADNTNTFKEKLKQNLFTQF